MATITDLPCVLLYHIIFLLVKSSGGAADFARTISVCRNFLTYAEDVSILRVVNFNTIKIGLANFYDFQNVEGLLVKCSEAGNIAAQYVLGKIILLSSTYLFLLNERQNIKYNISPRNLSLLHHEIVDTSDPARNDKVGCFMAYFSPLQVGNSEFSATRLVHYQLVKLILLNGSHLDFIRIGVYLKYCISYFVGVTRENSSLVASIDLLVRRAHSVGRMAMIKKSFSDYLRGVKESLEGKGKIAEDCFWLISLYIRKCRTAGVSWQEGINDMNVVEAVRQEVSDQHSKAFTNFSKARAEALSHFEDMFG